MPLVTSTQMLISARQQGYAVGAFNANNMEAVQAIVEAAEEERAPVIVQISAGAIAYAGLRCIASLVKVEGELASVPVVLHFDHGPDFESNMRCLRHGFTSLMYDGSRLRLEDNIRVSREIAAAAHACGVPVEAELGRIPRIEDYEHLLPDNHEPGAKLPPEVQAQVDGLMAEPDQAAEFCERTQCDSLAVAIGSVHGMKRDVQPLNIQRLQALAECTGVPLVLHGASGVIRNRKDAESAGVGLASHEGTLEDAIRLGVAKVNVGTEIGLCMIRGMRGALTDSPGLKDVRKALLPGKIAAKEAVRSFIRLFGSNGKAEGRSSAGLDYECATGGEE